MKKILAIALCVVMLGSFATMFAGCGKTDAGEVNVYNWGEYIAEGQDGLMNVIEEFEKETGIKVNYTTYETNEETTTTFRTTSISTTASRALTATPTTSTPLFISGALQLLFTTRQRSRTLPRTGTLSGTRISRAIF